MIYEAPNHTQVPNAIFEDMPDMEPAELRVVLVVCWQTLGRLEQEVRLSASEFQELTGLSLQELQDGISAAVDRGVLARWPSGNTYAHRLVFDAR